VSARHLLDSILAPLREDVRVFRRRGLNEFAEFEESLIADIESAFRAWETQLLTLREAAAESGYAYSTLQQKVAAGDIPNAGEAGKPRVRRCDIPTPPSRRTEPESGVVDLAQEILNRGSG
jgi:hypothetical protein